MQKCIWIVWMSYLYLLNHITNATKSEIDIMFIDKKFHFYCLLHYRRILSLSIHLFVRDLGREKNSMKFFTRISSFHEWNIIIRMFSQMNERSFCYMETPLKYVFIFGRLRIPHIFFPWLEFISKNNFVIVSFPSYITLFLN